MWQLMLLLSPTLLLSPMQQLMLLLSPMLFSASIV
jgi:hypothetical protein